jgi:hypothetical protein
MNTKNLILGLAAIVFAIGSAFTTKEKLVSTPYIWMKEASNSSFECFDVPGACATNGSTLCKVSIVLESEAIKTPNAHTADNCATTYSSDNDGSAGSTIDFGGVDRPFAVSNDGTNPL